MTDGRALLFHCVLLPGDLTARVVFADWLDENGFPRLARRARSGGKGAWPDKLRTLLKLSQSLGRLPGVALLDCLCHPRLTKRAGQRVVGTASFLRSFGRAARPAGGVIAGVRARGWNAANLVRVRLDGQKTATTFHQSFWMDDPDAEPTEAKS